MSSNIKKKNKLLCKNSLNDNKNINDLERTPTHSPFSSRNNLKIIEICSKKLAKKPNNKRALLLRASIFIKIGKYEEARNDLQILLEDNNLASTAYYLLGIINKEINNNELALKFFTKSIELDDHNINAYFLRGAINNILGNYKEAIKDYNEAIYKDALKLDGNNVYKNISKIFTQTLYNKKYSKQNKRKSSLINERKNNYMINKFQINYNSEKTKNKVRCFSEENNLRKKNLYEEKNKNVNNIIVNSTSNNFNFFIRNIAYKKNNGKDYDTNKLLKEINSYLNEEDNDEKLTFSLESYIKNEETIKNRNNDIFHKSITSNDCERSTFNQTIENNNYSNGFITINKSPMQYNNHIFYNSNDVRNKSSGIQKSKSFYIDNYLISENLLNSGGNNHFSNSQNLYNNKNNLIQNRNITFEQSINKATNNKSKSNSPSSEISSKSIFNYKKDNLCNDNKLNLSPYEKQNFLFSDKKNGNNLQKMEDLNEDEILCIKGEKERSQGNYNEAISLFTKAIQINPKSFKAFFNRAFSFDKIGLYNQAISDYTSTIYLKPNQSFCYYNRGITYNKIGELEKSIYDFSKAIELEPNRPEFYFNRACLYKNTKQYQNAINDFTIVIKIFPKLYTPVYNRGICYEKLKLYQSSIKDFETCIKIAKNNIHPYYHIATIYKILEEYNKSIFYLKKLIEIKPDYSPAFHDIGVILTQLGDNNSAILYFNKCIELDNNKPIYYHNRGWAYRTINFENAIKDMNTAINLDNKNPKFYFNRASIYKNAKIYSKAIEDYSTIILRFDNKNYESYANRGFCFAQLNNFYDAINDYTKALEIKNDDYESLCSRADLFININDYILAIEDLNKIIKINPNNENAYIKRAKCFENIKNIKESCSDYESALLLSGKKQKFN